ncbi:MAG: carboxylesterase family protein [Actinomycetota bacterium]|nr:carboxylesterase family protein [Actinomycetota bacterium]
MLDLRTLTRRRSLVDPSAGARRARARHGVVLVLLLLAAACSGTSSSAAEDTAAPTSTTAAVDAEAVVSTPLGPVRGVRSPLGTTFRAIPYAAAPVGDLRWRQPREAAPWDGELDATEPGPVCPQLDGTGQLEAGSDEDCLRLNIDTPRAPDGPAAEEAASDLGPPDLPVVVWVHGGGFIEGAANEYDGARLAAGGDVVVVTINYRLGALGYLALEGFEDPGSAGMFAVDDIVAALRWVEANISAFGGDSANVTVAGQSAGGINICSLMATPAAFGLFDRAIVQSGPCTWARPLDEATEVGAELAAGLGCTGSGAAVVACLRALPVEDLVAASPPIPSALGTATWLPVSGGTTMPRPLPDAIEAREFAEVPVLLGTVHDEGRGEIPSWDTAENPLDDQRLDEAFLGIFGDGAAAVAEAYPSGSLTPQERLARVITDAAFACPTELTAAALHAGGVAVYRYEFDLPDNPPVAGGADPGATHNWDLPYVLPASDDWDDDESAQLSARMIGYWSGFAASGVPSAADAPTWAPYEISDPVVLELTPGAITPITDFATEHHCDLWT